MPLLRPAPGTGKWWVVGIVGCTIGVALATWLALANTLGQVTWTDTGYKVLDDRSVRVDFDVHRQSGQAVTCRVQALDQTFAVVGVLDVAVPATAAPSLHRQVVVRTASRAVTGVVQRCTPTP
jgi:ABC-type lipoprotein release transport system permease subunit